MLKSSSLYAAIDLGSNSFHMLVVREIAGSIQVLSRVKRKVRLAAGLNSENELSEQAMERGWQCLRLFLNIYVIFQLNKSESSQQPHYALLKMQIFCRKSV